MQNGRMSLLSDDYNNYDRKMPRNGDGSFHASRSSPADYTFTSRYGRPVLDASKQRSRAMAETDPSRDAREALRQAAARRRSLGDQQFQLQLVGGPSISSETMISTSERGRRASASDGGFGSGNINLSLAEYGSVRSTSWDIRCDGIVDAPSNGGGGGRSLRSRWPNCTATAAAATATGVKDTAATTVGDQWWLNRNKQGNKLEPEVAVGSRTSKCGGQTTPKSDRDWESYESKVENWKSRANSQPPAWSNGMSSSSNSSNSTSGWHPVGSASAAPSSPLRKYSSSTTLPTCGRDVDAKLDNGGGRPGESADGRTAWLNKYLLDRTATKRNADFDGFSGSRKRPSEEPEVASGRGSSLVASLINSFERVGVQSELEREKPHGRNVDAAWIHADGDFRGQRNVRSASLSNLNVVGLSIRPETASSTSDADDRRRSSLHSDEVARRCGTQTSTAPAERRTRAEGGQQQRPLTYDQFVELWKTRIDNSAEASAAEVVAATSKTAPSKTSGSSVDVPPSARSSTTTGVRASAAFPAGRSQPPPADLEDDRGWLQRRRNEFAKSAAKYDDNEANTTRKELPKTVVDADWTSLAARPRETLPSSRASSTWTLKTASNTAASTPSSTDDYAFDLHSRRGSDVTSASAGTAGSFQSDDSGVVGCGFPSTSAVGRTSKMTAASGTCVTKLELPTGLRAAAVSKDRLTVVGEIPSSRSSEAGGRLRGSTTSRTELRSFETEPSVTQKHQPMNNGEVRVNTITATSSSINRPTATASDIGTRLNSKYGMSSFVEVDADKVDRDVTVRQTSPSPGESPTSSSRLQEQLISHRRTKSMDELDDDAAPVVIKTRRIGWRPSTDLTSSETGCDVTTTSSNDQLDLSSSSNGGSGISGRDKNENLKFRSKIEVGRDEDAKDFVFRRTAKTSDEPDKDSTGSSTSKSGSVTGRSRRTDDTRSEEAMVSSISTSQRSVPRLVDELPDSSAQETVSGLPLNDIVLTSTRSRRRSNHRGDSGDGELQLTSRLTRTAADEDSSLKTTSSTESAPVALWENHDNSDVIRPRIGTDVKQVEKAGEPVTDSCSVDRIAACGDPVQVETGRRDKKGRLEVQLDKGATGLGFCIEGGKGSSAGDKPITVKRLFKSHVPAQESLQVGDEIVSVDGKDLTNMSHFEAWNYLKAIPDGKISLVIIRN